MRSNGTRGSCSRSFTEPTTQQHSNRPSTHIARTTGLIEPARATRNNAAMSPRAPLAASCARRVIPMLALLVPLTGCKTAPPPAPSFADQIATAHGLDDWNAEQALQGEFLARFETGEVIDLR